jgi:hypothetical protein
MLYLCTKEITMEEKIFKIPSLDTTEKRIVCYLKIMNPFLKGIRKTEENILVEIIKANQLKKSITDVKDRFKVIFSTENRKEMENNLGISSAVFRNGLTDLRTKRLLLKDNILHPLLLLDFEEKDIKVSFII